MPPEDQENPYYDEDSRSLVWEEYQREQEEFEHELDRADEERDEW